MNSIILCNLSIFGFYIFTQFMDFMNSIILCNFGNSIILRKNICKKNNIGSFYKDDNEWR
jgi:hypothetical protein